MCGCQMRTSYGLPCAHEKTMYLRNENPLPLDLVHIFWKKFDLHPYICLEDDDVDIDVEVQTSNTRSQKQSRSSKFSWFQKAKDIFSPSTTSLREPTSQKKQSTYWSSALKHTKTSYSANSRSTNSISSQTQFCNLYASLI